MSKKRSVNAGWCVPSFDEAPVRSKKPTDARNRLINQQLDDGDDILFDIAVDIVDKIEKQPEENIADLGEDYDDWTEEVTNCFNLSTLTKACEPKVSSDLVLSRQKQNEIANWLTTFRHSKTASILLISGPAGCGKTLAFKVLAQEHGFSICEWLTPIDQAVDENGRTMKQLDRFLDFLLRATRYSDVFNANSKRLLLVKDLPNIFVNDQKSFFVALEKYNALGRDPLVFVCTDGSNSRLMTTLFAQSVRDKYHIEHININATTPTAMKNMLKRVTRILNSKGADFLNVTQSKIDEVLANNIGDIRSALLNLIFCSLKVPKLKNVKSECSSREDTLGLLHAIGRVINPKRTDDGNTWKFVHDPDEMATYFRSQARTFSYFLHENYMNTMRSIEQVELSADVLSIADLLNAEWKDPALNSVILSLCVRGVMVANTNPVTGWNPVRKPQNTDFEVKRNYEQAEIQWYEKIIKKDKPKNETQTTGTDIETIIETDL